MVMTGPRKKEGDSEGDSGFVTPDSTTREKVPHFTEGEDVLSHGKDGLYYLGTIVVVDLENERCLVHFEDNTAHWSLFKDITKLRIPESDELCVNCKSSRSTKNNEIVLCAVCGQGYHQNCVQPSISVEFCEGDGRWECPRCESSPTVSKEEKKKVRDSVSPKKQKKSTNDGQDEQGKRVLPYNLSLLTWDSGHKSNKEQTFCYCGGPGEWYNKMMQCNRCRQWFHEACVDCLHFPLLYGDRFYVFVCALCNGGCEFLHRLDLQWVEVVQLALFNLSLAESHPYFDYNLNITQWITDNWESLQCPLALQSVCVRERKRVVFKILNSNKSRFKCSKLARKRCSHWSLSVRVPPPVMTVQLPEDIPITHDLVKNAVVSYNKQTCSSPPIKRTIRDRFDEKGNVVHGFTPAKKHPTPSCDSSPQNPDEYPNRRKRRREIERLLADNKGKTKKFAEPPAKRKRGRPSREDSKKHTPNAEFKRFLRDKENSILPDKVARSEPESSVSNAENGFGDISGDDTSSRGTLDSFIPPPTNFEGANNPFSTLIRPVNITKKQLCASDIKIGKNGEVKRRRYRRKNGKPVYVAAGHRLPLRSSDVRIRNCFDYVLNGRERGTSTLSELQSTVNTYFGASKRIADGEKFRVLAKRRDPSGRCQYLVEWGMQGS